VITINLGGKGFTTFEALGLAVLLSGAAAAILGYFMIWGRVGGVFFGIVTLASSLVLAFFLGQTAGPEWKIGPRSPQWLQWHEGDEGAQHSMGRAYPRLDGAALYYLMVALVVIVYLGLRMLVNSRFGNVIVAIRENEQRAELLGYDVRKYRLATFCIGSALAGLSGALYTAWGQFITPASVGLPAAAMPIVWVSFSGRRELTATLFGTFIFLYAYQLITVYSQQSALVLTGLLLLLAVMFIPEGFVVGLAKLARMPWRKGSGTQLSLQPGE
jgi:urea transport system permease protein